MPAEFADSNILLYLVSEDVPKQERAKAILTARPTISIQVLNEIVNVARRKFRASWPEVHVLLAQVRAFSDVVALTLDIRQARGGGRRQLCLRFRQADPVRGSAGEHEQRRPVEAVARHRPARRRHPARRARLPDGAARQAGADHGCGGGRPAGAHHGNGRRLRRQAGRRPAGRGAEQARTRRLPARRGDGHLPRPLSRELREAERDPGGEVQRYRVRLPPTNHVFQPGHRIMVQVQSSWFPLYDRNPQSYVPNIFFAKPGDYRKATITVERGGANPSAVWLPLVPAK